MASAFLFCPHCGAAYSSGEKQCAFCQHIFTEELDLFDQQDLFHERYQILNQIGTGGFGAVYKARDTQGQQRLVAIKQINLRGLTTQEIIEATDGFNRERQFLSSLSHDHLPKIYDYFMDTEHWYLIMEFIEGQTLEAYLQSLASASTSFVRALSVDEIVDIGLQLCDVLNYLHGQLQPIIFRDLKPSNVMRTDLGAIYLIDFGIARYFKPGKLKDTIPFGSPGYAAPEQYGKGQTTAQADIYSLGALLYYMLSGLDPAENPFHFAPLRLYGTAGLASLELLIMQMVTLDVWLRPKDVQVVAIELQHIRQLRESSEPRIWRPPTAQTPISAAHAAGSTSYWPGSVGQSGQQQSQMYQPQAQRQGAGTPGIARRVLIKRGWQICIAVGAGAMLFHNVIPSLQSSSNNTGVIIDHAPNGPFMQSIFETTIGGAANITTVQHSSDGQLFAVADQAGNVSVWNTTTQRVIYQWQVKHPVISLSWTVDAKYLSIAAGRSVYIWEILPVKDDTQAGKILSNAWATYDNILPATVQTVSWNLVAPMTLAVGDIDGNVQVFKISSKEALSAPLYKLAANSQRSRFPNGPHTIALNWVGSRLHSLFDLDSVRVWDLASPRDAGITITFPDMREGVQAVLWITSAQLHVGAIVLTLDGQVKFVTEDYQVSQDILNVDRTIKALVCSDDGQYVFGVADDGIYVWFLPSLMDKPNFFWSQGTTQSIDYVVNEDGKFVITGGLNGAIEIWQVA